MLSKKAQGVFQYIVRFARENGFPPTLREIGEEFEIASTNGVRYFLEILERDGYVRRNGRISRGLEVPEESLRRFIRVYGSANLGGAAQETEGIPILGRVAAGSPIFAAENIEGRLNLEDSFSSRSQRFALRVKGDSMVDAGIVEDDLVVVRQTDHADNGAIVVALIGDEATVKTFRRHPDRVELWPANRKYRPIVVHDPEEFRILGVVLGLVRPSIKGGPRRRH
jgi:repressor LexA